MEEAVLEWAQAKSLDLEYQGTDFQVSQPVSTAGLSHSLSCEPKEEIFWREEIEALLS